jgi:hypothetical protein
VKVKQELKKKYMKKKLIGLKREINKSTNVVREFNTLLSIIYKHLQKN